MNGQDPEDTLESVKIRAEKEEQARRKEEKPLDHQNQEDRSSPKRTTQKGPSWIRG
jgi:hypothetical protein